MRIQPFLAAANYHAHLHALIDSPSGGAGDSFLGAHGVMSGWAHFPLTFTR